MLTASFLVRSRHSIFYFRWPIPRQAHPLGQPSEIKLSLRTRDPKLALQLSRYFGYLAGELASRGMAAGMRYDEIRKELHGHFSALLSKTKEQIAENGRLDALTLAALSNGHGFAGQAVEQNVPVLTDGFEETSLDRFIEMRHLAIGKPSLAYETLRAEFRRAYKSFCQAVLDHDGSLDSFEFDAAPQVSPAAPAQQKTHRHPLDVVAKQFVAESQLGERWTEKTEAERSQHLKLLFQICGADADIADIDPTKARHVKAVLQKYPRNKNKVAATRDLSIEEILELSDVQTLHVQSINKYLQTYNGLFSWAKRQGYVRDNVFEGLSIRRKANQAKSKRKSFSPHQVKLMLEELIENKSNLIHKDFQKWGPLIGIYSGARLNEIAQIHLNDIRKVDDVWVFDLNDEGDDKQLKTESSRRLVPIHRALIERGLLEYTNELKEQGKSKLFPGLTYCSKNGWGRNLGRWFNETFLVKLDMKSHELVFHSLRHTVVTQLLQAGVEEAVVKSIVGHSQAGVTQQNYFSDGYTLAQLSQALHKLAFV